MPRDRQNPTGKAKIIEDLKQIGLLPRKSTPIVNAVFKAWKEALSRREKVETPVGDLVVLRFNRRRFRFNANKNPGFHKKLMVEQYPYPLVVKLKIKPGKNIFHETD